VYGAIYVGSTTAFNSFVSLAILGLNVSYTVPQAIVLLRGRKNVLPKRPFDLGPILGPFCNAFSIAWVAVYTVLFCFPVFLPVTLNSMNYLSVVVAGVCLFILILWWGGKRKTFVGPTINLEIFDSVALGLSRTPSSASEPRNPEVKYDSKPAV
jgi:choline transport protein